MGEIADMMLDGTLCEGCGSYIGSDAGFAQYCSPECASDRGAEYIPIGGDPAFPRRGTQAPPNPKKTNCPKCGKRVKKIGLSDHIRDAHGGSDND